MTYKSSYLVEDDTIKKVSRTELADWQEKSFTDKQKWQDGANLDNLKLVAGKVTFKSDADKAKDRRDRMSSATKLEIRRAMRTLQEEDKLNTLLQNPEFGKDWADAVIIELDDPLTQAAMLQIGVDIDQLKQQILDDRAQ